MITIVCSRAEADSSILDHYVHEFGRVHALVSRSEQKVATRDAGLEARYDHCKCSPVDLLNFGQQSEVEIFH